MRRALGCALVVALFASVLLAPSAGAKVRYPRLDGTFGSGGYVALPSALPAPGGEPMRIEGMGATRSGGVYVSETSLVGNSCRDKCLYDAFLARVNTGGAIATTFGGSGRVQYGSGVEKAAVPIADLKGRALVATLSGTTVTVRRYLANGGADNSFGIGGTTTIDFGGGVFPGRQLALALDEEGRIVVSLEQPEYNIGIPVESRLARLLPEGGLDGGFGSGGLLSLSAQPPSVGITFGSNNAIYMIGAGYAGSYLHRISVKGRVDTKFNAQADRTLANVRGRGVFQGANLVLVPRQGGLLDLFGGDDVLRLRSNGTTETKFGEGGLRQLGWSILDATLVGHGKVLALGASSEGVSLVRMKSNGDPDRSFGSEGATLIEGVNEEEGLGFAWLNNRRVLVLDRGETFCRSGCGQKPTLIRYRIGPKQG